MNHHRGRRFLHKRAFDNFSEIFRNFPAISGRSAPSLGQISSRENYHADRDSGEPPTARRLAEYHQRTANDYLYGGNGKDQLNGGGGNDHLYGRGGDDILNGNDGNDYLNGGRGADQLNGGSGNDYIYAADGSATDKIDGGTNNTPTATSP